MLINIHIMLGELVIMLTRISDPKVVCCRPGATDDDIIYIVLVDSIQSDGFSSEIEEEVLTYKKSTQTVTNATEGWAEDLIEWASSKLSIAMWLTNIKCDSIVKKEIKFPITSRRPIFPLMRDRSDYGPTPAIELMDNY
jgi:hypothetical protein